MIALPIDGVRIIDFPRTSPPIAGIARDTSQTWTIHGEVESTTDANANTTTNLYDTLGRRTSTTRVAVDGESATTQTGYDQVGSVIRTTDARGNVTTFTVDKQQTTNNGKQRGHPQSCSKTGLGQRTEARFS